MRQMNHAVRNKLQSQQGVSIIITMVLFLVCAMISSVIIAAAASGSSRNVGRTERERAYLAIGSAAELLMGEFNGLGSCTSTNTASLNGNLAAVIGEAVQSISGGSTNYEESFTVKLDVADERLPEVQAKFHMDAAYKITILLETTVNSYSATIIAPLDVTATPPSNISWVLKPTLEKGGAAYAN